MQRSKQMFTRTAAAAVLAMSLSAGSASAVAQEVPYSTADGTDVMNALIILPARLARALLMSGTYAAYLPLTTLAGTEPHYYDEWIAKQYDALLDHSDQ